MTAALLSLAIALGQVGSVAVGGNATWYDGSAGHAAAGPTLRAALGPDWRGTAVQVCAADRCLVTVVDDFCACGERNGKDTLLDLDDVDFAKLAPLSTGVVAVTVTWGWELPATDTAPDLAYWLAIVK